MNGAIPRTSEAFVKQVSSRAYDMRMQVEQSFDNNSYDESLEALQDPEHEKQRRHFLYYPLHQVPVSSNFRKLMRKKACQIALLIVLRRYRIDPPCPPYECAHMWARYLVSSLMDASLHSFLQQPAIDLVQTIVVSDASALISVILKE